MKCVCVCVCVHRKWRKFVDYFETVASWGEDRSFNGVRDVSFIRIPAKTAGLKRDDYKIAYAGCFFLLACFLFVCVCVCVCVCVFVCYGNTKLKQTKKNLKQNKKKMKGFRRNGALGVRYVDLQGRIYNFNETTPSPTPNPTPKPTTIGPTPQPTVLQKNKKKTIK